MTATTDDPMSELSDDDCWALLRRGALGRLAVCAAGIVDVFPVNYTVSGGRILMKTREGTKLAAMLVQHRVAFEIDGVDEQAAWSVVVHGDAQVIDAEAGSTGPVPIVSWLPTVKSRIVAITPSRVSGPGFLRGDEPDAEWY